MKTAKLVKISLEHAQQVYNIAIEKLQQDRAKHARKYGGAEHEKKDRV